MVDLDPSAMEEAALDPQPLRLDALLRATVEKLAASLPGHIAVDYRLYDEDAMVVADASELTDVLVALCHDVRSSLGDEAATISITVDRQPLPVGLAVTNVEDSYLALAVSHDAKNPKTSLSEEHRALLRKVAKIVGRFNGFVDGGSSVRAQRTALLLPEYLRQRTRGSIASRVDTPSTAPLVLLAEDEPTISRIATRILTRAGYRVVSAHDGHEALALVDAHRDELKLAILDAVMPGLSGQEVFARIKQLRPDLPVLFSSGYDHDSWPPALLEQTGVALLPKPYDPPMLLSALEKLLP